MKVDFKFDIGDVVYYPNLHALEHKMYVKQGKIQGFMISKKNFGVRIGVNFKGDTNVSIDGISKDKGEVEALVNRINEKMAREEYE